MAVNMTVLNVYEKETLGIQIVFELPFGLKGLGSRTITPDLPSWKYFESCIQESYSIPESYKLTDIRHNDTQLQASLQPVTQFLPQKTQ